MGVTRFPARASGVGERMAGFIAHLRMNGLQLGPQETADALRTLSVIDATDPQVTRHALASLLVPDAETWRSFDDLFDAYWFNAGKQREAQAANPNVRVQSARPTFWTSHFETPEGSEGDGAAPDIADDGAGEAEGTDGRLMATRTQNLMRRDLRELVDDATIAEAERVAQQLAAAIRDRRSRRRKQATRGR